MELRAAGGNEGWMEPYGPLVNEMLVHDVYDLPREVLRAVCLGGEAAGIEGDWLDAAQRANGRHSGTPAPS